MNIGFTLNNYGEYYINLASRLGFDCLEVSADRGTALDVEKMTKDDYKRLAEEREKYGVSIDSVTSMVNHLAGDTERRDNNKFFMRLIQNAHNYGSQIVMTNAFGDPYISPEENMSKYKEVFSEYARAAEDAGVSIVLENCPHSGGYPCVIGNIGYSPAMWEVMFDAVPSQAIGIEYDPSHMVWQQMDYLEAIYDFGDRIYAFHAKDTEINNKQLKRNGIYGSRAENNSGWVFGWWRHRIPGMGLIDWTSIFTALYDVNFKGPMFIEHEDPVFHGERFEEGLWMGLRHLQALAPPIRSRKRV